MPRAIIGAAILISSVVGTRTESHWAMDPHVHVMDMPGAAAGRVLGFSYGQVPPSEKLAVFDLDGTLINPQVCTGEFCPKETWESRLRRLARLG